jgi:hypothetical protein
VNVGRATEALTLQKPLVVASLSILAHGSMPWESRTMVAVAVQGAQRPFYHISWSVSAPVLASVYLTITVEHILCSSIKLRLDVLDTVMNNDIKYNKRPLRPLSTLIYCVNAFYDHALSTAALAAALISRPSH